MANIGTRMVVFLASAGLSFVGAADAALADPQPSYSDGFGYDRNGAYNDGMGYDRNGVFDDGMGYTDRDGSTDDFSCDDNDAHDAYGIDNCGWNGGYFYPGFGAFVFDRNHHRHHMTGRQHDYYSRQARGPVDLGGSGAGARTGFGISHGGTSGGVRGGGHRG